MKLEDILDNNCHIDKKYLNKAKKHTEKLIIPHRAMGKLHNTAEKICAIRKTLKPDVDKRAVFIMVGDHGIVNEGVSSYPQEVTLQMVNAFLNEAAAVNVLAKQAKADVIVTDVGSFCTVEDVNRTDHNIFLQKKISRGTKNFLKEPAMSYEQAIKSIEIGFEVTNKYIIEKELNLIATGDMGIGNTTSSSAIGAVISGQGVEKLTGSGSGIDEKKLALKINIIKSAIKLHNPDKNDAIDILSKIGGFEIGAIAGSILAAAYNNIPIIIDGIISTSAALIAYTLKKEVSDYMIAGHMSAEPGHRIMLEYLKIDPLLSLDMRLGEGTGALIAMHIIESAVKITTDVATFEEAGVSTKNK